MRTIESAMLAAPLQEARATAGRRPGCPGFRSPARLLWAAILLSIAPLAPAATNDLVATLQQGLFDEEANHDLAGAIKYYQSVVDRFDENRKLAATALFRLGECYRKQGHTNQANAQYERVLREFADQTQFVTLSRAYLAAAGESPDANRSDLRPSTSAEAEEVSRIRAMIKDSPDLINARNPDTGQTPLHKAAALGQFVVAQFLLANGADVDARNPKSLDRTALHLAAEAGHKAIVELLISYKANVRAADRNGFAPLHLAVQHGFRSVIETLLAHGADVNAKTLSGATPLHFAAVNGFRAIAEVLLANGADVNAVASAVRSTTSQNFAGSPLHIAAARADDSLAGMLLTNRADVNLVDLDGLTPLHLAADRGSLKVAALLLARGAGVDLGKSGSPLAGATPLAYAVNANQKDMVALLLKNHADPNAPFESSGGSGFSIPAGKNFTPLLIATQRGFGDVLDLLLAGGADANLKDANGYCPLFASLVNDSATALHLVAALLDHGADVNTRDGEQATVLMRAAGNRRKEVVAKVLAHKPDVNAQDQRGNSALHYLVYSLNSSWSPSQGGSTQDALPILESLIAAGADVNARNREGRTPLACTPVPPWPPSPMSTGTAPGSVAVTVAELLRQHGALTELPDFDSIRVTRVGLASSYEIFRAQTNRLNHFTAMEAIANFYLSGQGAYSTMPRPGAAPGFSPPPLRFPDFSRVKILRPTPGKLGERKEILVGLLSSTDTLDCGKDVALEFGDVIEVPEREHPLSESPVGLTKAQETELLKCLGRKVTVLVKGQPLDVDLDGGRPTSYLSKALSLAAVQAFLRSSSDLSRLVIKRPASAAGQAQEIAMDVLPFWNNRAPLSDDLWLRNGDVIEVPDKP